MIASFLATLALSSLPLIFISSNDNPASLSLPPFEKELYLSISAKWANEATLPLWKGDWSCPLQADPFVSLNLFV